MRDLAARAQAGAVPRTRRGTVKFANYIHYIEDQDAIATIRPTHRAYLDGLLERGRAR